MVKISFFRIPPAPRVAARFQNFSKVENRPFEQEVGVAGPIYRHFAPLT